MLNYIAVSIYTTDQKLSSIGACDNNSFAYTRLGHFA